ncbi:MAG: Gfo/Idh/MocA family protein [Planctomycetota bacterium]
MASDVRIGLIGGGYWGKNLARNFAELGVLAAICDADSDSLGKYADLYPDVELSPSWSDVIDMPQVNAVAIATPPDTHYQMAEAAFAAGKDVFVEKPICHQREEARALNAKAAAAGSVLMTGHLLQYHAVLAEMRRLVQAGDLGRVRHVEARRLNIGKIYTERNVMWNFAPHDVSLALAMFGDALPEAVSCEGHNLLAEDICDMATLTLRYADGATAQVQVSWISPIKEARLLVYGTEASAVFDDVKPWEQKLQWFDGYTGVIDGRQARGRLSEPRFIPVDPGEPLRDECAHFVACCRERSEPLTSGREAERVIAVLEAAQASMEDKGRYQSVNG